MTEEPLTFSELRKIQKKERRNNELTELDQNFILDAAEYLQRKEDLGENNREYNNAKRVIDKIISIREEKIFKQAKIAVKTDVNPQNLNLLPREEKLFRNLKNNFTEHRKEIQDFLKKQTPANTKQNEEEKTNQEETNNQETQNEREEVETNKTETKDVKEGYARVKITNQVPEFMGTDLNSYGPFEEGENAEIPEENAEILINRGNAEEIEQ